MPTPLLQFWLRVKQVKLAGASFHEEEDHIFSPSCEVRGFGFQRIHTGQSFNWMTRPPI
jgi:hypothetical protein